MDQDRQPRGGDSQDEEVVRQIEAALLAVRHEHGRRHPGPPFGQFGGGPWMRGGPRGSFDRGMHRDRGMHGDLGMHGGHDSNDHHDHGHDGDPRETGSADTRTDPAAGGARPGPGRRGRPDGPLGRIARFRMLEALEAAERDEKHLSISALAEAIGVDQPRASRLVQEGIERGMVRRVSDPADARRSLIELTAAGRSQLGAVRDRRRSTVERAIAEFTPEEAQAFADLFTRFVRALAGDEG